jgi:hypothetical protein
MLIRLPPQNSHRQRDRLATTRSSAAGNFEAGPQHSDFQVAVLIRRRRPWLGWRNRGLWRLRLGDRRRRGGLRRWRGRSGRGRLNGRHRRAHAFGSLDLALEHVDQIGFESPRRDGEKGINLDSVSGAHPLISKRDNPFIFLERLARGAEIGCRLRIEFCPNCLPLRLTATPPSGGKFGHNQRLGFVQPLDRQLGRGCFLFERLDLAVAFVDQQQFAPTLSALSVSSMKAPPLVREPRESLFQLLDARRRRRPFPVQKPAQNSHDLKLHCRSWSVYGGGFGHF